MSAEALRDATHMARALMLARRGLWGTDPNPRVGCVIARDGTRIAEGWHERAGEPHAEAIALAAAGAQARGATAYVTLEPCCHQGRTPPCAAALQAAGIARVVYAAADPDPRVNGGGAAGLRSAGVRVEGGLMESAARELNVGFHARLERGRPWLRLKLAASLDGRTALSGGQSRWITGEAARADVHRLRARSSVILTGAGTVRDDDPRLDVRLPGAWRQPLRVILDTRFGIAGSARVLALPGKALVFGTAANGGMERLRAAGVDAECLAASGDGVDLAAVLERLAALGANEVLAECGPRLAGALLAGGLVDEWVLYQSGTLLGPRARALADLPEPAALPDCARFTLVERRAIGEDWRLTLRPVVAKGDA